MIVTRRVLFVKLDRITVNPQICMGQSTIRGTRFTVAFILKLLASGMGKLKASFNAEEPAANCSYESLSLPFPFKWYGSILTAYES